MNKQEIIENLKAQWMQVVRGGCKVVSFGDDCNCHLCLIDKLAHFEQNLNIHSVSGKQPYYQLCPKCFGEGTVMNYGYSTTAPIIRTCPTCQGAKTFLVES